ncbi:hypothetical protein QTP88_030019 [Uroleucon formosanum]
MDQDGSISDYDYEMRAEEPEDSPRSSPTSEYLRDLSAELKRKSAEAAPVKNPGTSELEAGLQHMRSSLKSAIHEARMSLTRNETPGMARIIALLEGATTTIGSLLSKKGKLLVPSPPLSPSQKKARNEDPQQVPPKPVMVDASTDTLLTPSWWDSDRVVEARAASKRRLARKSADATQQLARSGETEDDTAVDTDAGGTWAEVARRRRSRRKTAAAVASAPAARVPTKPASVAKKPPAILVKPSEGKSFADTVRAVRSCGFNAKDVCASVSMRETRDGSLLLELPKGAKSSAAAKTIAEALGTKLGDSVGRVSQLGVQVEIEVLDLDAVSSAAEVLEALRASVPGGDDPTAVAEREAICDVRIWPVRGGQQVATAKMSRYAASVITEVPVGWTICRVRPRTRSPERCFRCQAFGHNARSCTAQDRSGACWRCGETGHPMKDCKAGDRPPYHCNAMISFLQINLNCNWAAEQLMAQTADETGADVLIVSEPATHYGQEDRWCFSTDRKAAVGIARLSAISQDDRGSGHGFAWMAFGALTVFSCYLRPGATLQEFCNFLGQLETAILSRGRAPIVLAGDFNAWNVEWGSRVNNPRGGPLSDLAASLGLILANTGSAPTFERGAYNSVIDLTFYRGVQLAGWHVPDSETLSDHNYVRFNTSDRPQAVAPADPPVNANRGWSTRKLDRDALMRHLTTVRLLVRGGEASGEKALEAAEAMDSLLVGACEASMPRKTTGPQGRRPAYWWSDGIAELRRQSLALRRRYQSCLRRSGQTDVEEARCRYSAARRTLRIAIKQAKEKAWADLCSSVDTDPWGKPYRLVMKKFGAKNPAADARGREAAIADALFPAAPVTCWDLAPSPAVRNLFEAFDPEKNTLEFTMAIPGFKLEELVRAAKRLTSGKAPGPSGIPNVVLRALVTTQPHAVLRALNACLEALTFPPKWKRARLVLLKKGPDKPPDVPSSYRPICMLDTPGKLLERLLLQRLEEHMDAHGGRRRAPNQFGFRKGVSTESAIGRVLEIAAGAAATPRRKSLCVLVTLDVRNAFNSLRWPVIDSALRDMNTPEYLVRMLRSWLSDRVLLTGDELAVRPVTCGVPQGSVLGPALWNVAYNSLLKMEVPTGVHLVGFADDLAVVGVGVTGESLEEAVNPTLAAIDEWMRSRGLELAHQKSEAVILSRRRAFVPPQLTVGGHPIPLRGSLRYLGVILDKRLTFAAHVETVAGKAARSATALARLMPNIGGPVQWKRRLLTSVVDSQLLYAAPVWVSSIADVSRTRGNLIRPQRSAALRCIRAYRTVSDEAALVLACTIPADLLGLERLRIGKRLHAELEPGEQRPSKASVRRKERELTLTRWQARWRTAGKGAWTRRAIPNVVRWVGRTVPWVPLTYHMTQALTGHGCFQWYLHRMGRAESPRCLLCPCTSDTAEHTLFVCERWEMFREELSSRLGHRPTAFDVQELVCGPEFEALPEDPVEKAETLREAELRFRLFFQMVEKIMTEKEQLERQRQREEAAGVPE